MELLQLRYFYDCANNESIAKTAEKYMVPASSVSASIKRLEKELGNALFNRAANRITLNENGKKLRDSLKAVFSELDQTITDITCPTDDTEIHLLVRSLRSSITSYMIEYQEKHANMRFNSVFSSNEENIKNFHVIIDEQNDCYQGYECFKLASHKVFLRVSTKHPLCGKKLTLKQLADYPFATMGEQSHLHHKLIAICKNVGFRPNIIAQVNDISCYLKLLRSGMAIGHGREYGSGSAGDGLTYLNVTDFDMTQTIYVYYKKEQATGNVKNFVEFLKTKIQ